jgi:hypothetical protein
LPLPEIETQYFERIARSQTLYLLSYFGSHVTDIAYIVAMVTVAYKRAMEYQEFCDLCVFYGARFTVKILNEFRYLVKLAIKFYDV